MPRIIERVPEPERRTRADEAGAAAAEEPRFEGGVGARGAAQGDRTTPSPTGRGCSGSPSCVAGVTGGLIGLASGWQWGLLVVAAARARWAWRCGLIDWRTRLLPTWLIVRTYVVVVLLALVATAFTQDWQDLVRAGIGLVGAGLLYYVLWFVYPRGLGFGDVRLSGILGIALGYVGTAELVVGVYAGFLLGGDRRRAAGAAADRAPQARAVRAVHARRGRARRCSSGDWVGSLTNG